MHIEGQANGPVDDLLYRGTGTNLGSQDFLFRLLAFGHPMFLSGTPTNCDRLYPLRPFGATAILIVRL
jgi:hypothetical protein